MGNRQQKIYHRRWEIEQGRKNKIHRPYQPKRYRNFNGEEREIIMMPPILDIYSNNQITKGTLEVIDRLEKHKLSGCRTLILDFSHTTVIKAAVLVLLFSALDRLITESGKAVQIRFACSKLYSDHKGLSPQSRVKKLLEKSGIVDLCDTGCINNTFEKNHLPIISSSGGRYRDDIVDFIVKKIYKEMPADLENIYADAIQEAVNNVAAHAYLNQTDIVKSKKWWLLCEVINDQLYLVIYDAGIGIPKSFEVTGDTSQINWDNPTTLNQFSELYQETSAWIKEDFPTFDDLLNAVKKNAAKEISTNTLPDAHKIYIAMHGDMTRKEGKDELKHGQGSKSIKALVSNNEEGILWIYSGLGRMKFSDDSKTPALDSLPGNLTGTLIQWNIKVSS